MNATSKQVVAIGLPFMGKTTFLAALWDVVGSAEVAGALELVALEGDRHHLNDIRDRWADFDEIPRTFTKDEGVVSMRLRDVKSQGEHELSFADMSGETCERQWTERLCAESYLKLINDATGVLLFVNPEKVKQSVLIRDAQRLARRLPQAGVTRSNTASGAGATVDTGADPQLSSSKPLMAAVIPAATPAQQGAPPIPTEPHYAATQVKLVELLQIIELNSQRQPPFRVGVVVSAYDKVISGKSTPEPEAWLKRSLPLLHQYLRANPELFAAEFFGVSAQGGDLKDAVQLRRKGVRASDRIIVVRGTTMSHDITEPVRWILGLIN